MFPKAKIALFASGSGSNALKIIEHLQKEANFILFCNKAQAPVIEKCLALGIETVVFNRNDFYQTQVVEKYLAARQIDLIVLAGFLWLLPPTLIAQYPKRIINIHPSLLPQYGGKGMYGAHVHQAVFEAAEAQTGITIHFVNEKYDEGEIILQKSVSLSYPPDTPETIARKVQILEHQYFPQVVAQWISENFTKDVE
ncbi:phosphoribosylglycinamide formyltransferase [Hugenholtzia roseola]|uniref:phosphoribosylglycinamide formyltransferase n=1 Tax=Hugenholtzia roseola TaxID=1002 RepID=UPI000421CE2E|nr:phosphoribosylglycinamide formyltransferase [Hugenholtzia roseola]